jgi:hypothetical protein
MVDFALEENERRICEIETLITRQEMRIAKLQKDGRAPVTSACELADIVQRWKMPGLSTGVYCNRGEAV